MGENPATGGGFFKRPEEDGRCGPNKEFDWPIRQVIFVAEPMVRVFDPTTRDVATIPARELSSDMLPTEVEGIEGTVYVHVDQIEAGPILHKTLPAALIPRIERVSAAVREVYPQPDEEWFDAFQRVADLGAEIALWERIAEKYARLTSGVTDPEQKHEIFSVLANCAMNEPDIAALVINAPTLPADEIQRIVRTWAA